MAPLIEIRNLSVFYKTRRGYIRAVDNVSLDLNEGEALGIVGETGCGKSTLGKALLGVLPPGTLVRGEILHKMTASEREEMDWLEAKLKAEFKKQIESGQFSTFDTRTVKSMLKELQGPTRTPSEAMKDLKRLLKLKSASDLTVLPTEVMRGIRGEKMALIFQDPMSRLDPLMTVRDHFVELLQAHHDISEREAEERAVRALSSVGIPASRLKNYPHEFSGGMRQRIMIAMALVMNPELLIADEPTTSLDVLVEAQILKLIETLRRSFRMSTLLITHNLGIVAETCDRVGVMYAGKLVEVAKVSDLFSNPKHPYTQGLLSSIIHLETEELNFIRGTPPDLLNPPPGCRFHPRCPHVMDICSKAEPPMTDADASRAACFLYGEDNG